MQIPFLCFSLQLINFIIKNTLVYFFSYKRDVLFLLFANLCEETFCVIV